MNLGRVLSCFSPFLSVVVDLTYGPGLESFSAVPVT